MYRAGFTVVGAPEQIKTWRILSVTTYLEYMKVMTIFFFFLIIAKETN
jgi:hypothetical protein